MSDISAQLEELRRRSQKVMPAPASKGPRPLSSVFRDLIGKGKRPKYPTGSKVLDAACKGGLPVPRLVIVGGAPGAGKTTLVAQWARAFAEQGARVYCHCIDEGGEGLGWRMAQALGCDDDRLEDGDDAELERAADLLDQTGIVFTDDGVLDDHVAAWNPARGSVLIADSLQTITTVSGRMAEGVRARVDANTQTVKRMVAERGLLGIVTSEISRSFYKSRVDAEELNELAAFKESGGIEFAAETALVLREADDEKTEPPSDGQVVDVVVAKNRRYRKTPWRMVLDRKRAVFTDIDLPKRATKEDKAAAAEKKRHDALEREIVRVLSTGSHKTFTSVWKKTNSRRQDVFRLLKVMSDEARISDESGIWLPKNPTV